MENNKLDEIDIAAIVNKLVQGKKLIFFIIAFAVLISSIFSFLMKDYYESESVLKTASDDMGNLSQYSGLAALAGVNVPTTDVANVDEIIELVKSRGFVKHLLTFEGVLEGLIASKSFDDETGQLIYDDDLYDSESKKWVRKPKKGFKLIPSYQEAHKVYLEEILTVSKDLRTGLLTITVEHLSPIYARDLLSLIIREINSLKKKEDIKLAQETINKLFIESAASSNLSLKNSVNELIKAQLEKKMLAEIKKDYVLETIEPPFIPEERSKPNKLFIIMLSAIIGALGGILVVLFKSYFPTK